MGLLPAVIAIIELLPKVAPTLRFLKDFFLNKKDVKKVVSNLDNMKESYKIVTIGLLTAKQVIKISPTEEDNVLYEKGLTTLKEFYNNLGLVISELEK